MITAILVSLAFLSLIGVRFIPRAGRWRNAWYLFCLINLGVAAVLSIQSYHKGQQLEAMRSGLTAVLDFADIAKLNLNGKPFSTGPGITYSSDLSRMLESTYTTDGNRFQFKRGPDVESKLRAAIEKHPRFPFSYYALAYCLSKRGDPDWRQYAEKAVFILSHTTQIKGHKKIHDKILLELQEELERKPNSTIKETLR